MNYTSSIGNELATWAARNNSNIYEIYVEDAFLISEKAYLQESATGTIYNYAGIYSPVKSIDAFKMPNEYSNQSVLAGNGYLAIIDK